MVMLKIQVVFASPENQLVIDLEVREGTTIAAAVEQSGLRDELRAVGIDIDALTFGVWNKVSSGDDCVSDGDRVELYRPLEVDNLQGDSKKAKDVIGWQAKTKFKEIVSIMVQSDFKNIEKTI